MQAHTKAFTVIEHFLTTEMKMTHVYQPVVVRTLLKHGGTASLDVIAKALLSEDQAQLEYYRLIFKRWPLSTLRNRGIVTKSSSSYQLIDGSTLTPHEVDHLVRLCDAKIDAFLATARDPWSHRRRSTGYISGSLRYRVLTRANHRCELCGANASDVALHLDHIIPRAKGGVDDESNLQALCITCNAMKRDQDDTDFRGWSSMYDHREPKCIFCDLPTDRIVDQDRLILVVRDQYPVTEGHTLLIPKRHFASGGDLTQPELNSLWRLQDVQRKALIEAYPDITGFNFGLNDGASAGQTVGHCHFHLIPRRDGDTPNPRGGVRGVIPDKQSY